MPCRDDGPRGYCNDPALEERLDLVTRLLCRTIETNPDVLGGDTELQAWWKRHQKADAARKKAEAEANERERQRGLDRLKQVEMEANALRKKLGLK